MDDWNPDLELLDFLKEDAKKRKRERLAVGPRILTWPDVVEEMRMGTAFGRQFYKSLLKTLSENPKFKKDFEKWKKRKGRK